MGCYCICCIVFILFVRLAPLTFPARVCFVYIFILFCLGLLLYPRARETVSDSSVMNRGWYILTLLFCCCYSRLDGALSYGVLLYSLFLVFLFYGLQLVSKLSRDSVIRCLHFLSTPVQEHPLYLEKITLSISLLLRYRPLVLKIEQHRCYYVICFNE